MQCHIAGTIAWYHTCRHEQWKRLFFSGPTVGLALAAKTCPHWPQSCKRSTTVRRFRRKKPLFFVCFLMQSISGTPRYAYKKFRANSRRSDCIGLILRHASYLIVQSWSYYDAVKLSTWYDLKATMRISYVFRTKARMSTPFLGDRSWNFADVLFCTW